ncbi:phage portal protein [Yinghuangia sp. YIM S09857]|uniref:phage portal protein n=1 Tax=Yinghuangia sp. YIM S09857 TaxID=3436929 RepID=UPI003F53797A
MGFIRSAARGLGPLSDIATPEQWVVDWINGGSIGNSSGIHVSPETALMYSPFFAGMRVIAEDLGSLPLFLYERLARGKRRATEHPLYALLHDQPNPMMTSMQLRETLQSHATSWGDGVAALVTHPRTGVIEEIWPLRPDRLCIYTRPTGRAGQVDKWFVYDDQVNGVLARLHATEVLHIAGLGFDGVRGYPVVDLAANAIGLGLATEHYGAKHFSNGSAPGGALSHPGNLSPDARRRMADDWENIHRGIDRAHRVAILEEGVTWQQVGIPNDSAQFLETRKLQVTEMARWLRLPPHKIGDLERATFSNIEQQQLDYITSALGSWLMRWEQAILTQLLLPEERSRYFAEHLVDALLRGDTLSRYQAYAVGRQWGWLSANDIREMENRNPIAGGDTYLVPLNMVPAGGGAPEEDTRTARRHARLLRGRGAAVRRAIADTYAPKIADVDAEVAALEAAEVKALVDQHLEPARAGRSVLGFLAALRALYAEGGPIAAAMSALWLPLFTEFAADVGEEAAAEVGHEDDVDLSVWAAAYVASHVAYRVSSSFGQLRKAAEAADDVDTAVADVLARLDKWQAERPEQTARWESKQLSNAAAREAWKDAGIRELRWVTQGSKDCPYCKKLDGRTVGIEKPFVAKGAEIDGDAEGEKLAAKRNTFHPPLHVGCDCQVVPVAAD